MKFTMLEHIAFSIVMLCVLVLAVFAIFGTGFLALLVAESYGMWAGTVWFVTALGTFLGVITGAIDG